MYGILQHINVLAKGTYTITRNLKKLPFLECEPSKGHIPFVKTFVALGIFQGNHTQTSNGGYEVYIILSEAARLTSVNPNYPYDIPVAHHRDGKDRDNPFFLDRCWILDPLILGCV